MFTRLQPLHDIAQYSHTGDSCERSYHLECQVGNTMWIHKDDRSDTQIAVREVTRKDIISLYRVGVRCQAE